MRYEAGADVRTNIAGTRADSQEIHCLYCHSGCSYTVHDCETANFHGPMEIALIHLVRALGAVRHARQMEMTVINVTVEEYIANAFALVTRRMKAFFLRKPERRARCPNTNDPRIGHFVTIVPTKK